jgi:transaldolase
MARDQIINPRLQALHDAGVSIWLDTLSRELLDTGEFALEDVRRAADLLRPAFDESEGQDGFVSFECTPDLAEDIAGTIEQALELWRRLSRPNVMIKVPATEAGIPAIEELTARGVNVNVTLLFSLARYEAGWV